MPTRDDLLRFATQALMAEGYLTTHCDDCVAAWPHKEHRQMVYVSTPVSDEEHEGDPEGWWVVDDWLAEFDEIARAWLRDRLGGDAETLADAVSLYRDRGFVVLEVSPELTALVESAEAVLALLTEGETDG